MTDTAAARLRALLEVVLERNPFHQGRLEPLGIGPDAAVCDLPLLAKADLVDDQQRHPPFGSNLSYPLDRYVRIHQTSGTTGRPLRVLDTAADWAWWRELFARTLTMAGVGRGDRVALAFSFGPHIQFWAANEGLGEVGATAVPLGGMTSAQRVRTMADVGVTALWCTPTYAIHLLGVAADEGLEEALAPVQRVICTGEPGASLPSVRARIEEGFGARCIEHAGLTEAGPFGYPCAEGHGLHVDEDEFLCEILTPEGAPTPLGERGELVLTPLRRTGYPVLRYRTGDVVVNTDEACPAGHPHRWLPGGIVGRADDMVVIRGMNVHPSAIEDAVRRVTASGEFRITFYTEPRGLDEIKLEVELDEAASARRLQDTIRVQLGLRVRIVPVAPGLLPRPEGKTRRVVDQREGRFSAPPAPVGR